jgi:hypothetical protein
MSLHANEWSRFVNLTPSTSTKVVRSMHAICENGVQIDYQNDGHRITFRMFGRKELIPCVRSWLKKEELQMHYPVDLEPSYPSYNPQETYRQTPQGNFDTSFWIRGTWYWREVPATIEIPEEIQVQDGEIREISSMDFYVELPSHSPPRKRQRLTSDGHKGQDNLPCSSSSTTVSVTTSDNTSIPTTSILAAATRPIFNQQLSLAQGYASSEQRLAAIRLSTLDLSRVEPICFGTVSALSHLPRPSSY